MRDLEPNVLTTTGYTERGRDGRTPIIHLQAAAPDVRKTLAHELVHALAAEELRRFPPLMEEGHANWVARQVAPMTDEERLAAHVHVAAYFDAMLLSLELDAPEGPRALELELGLSGEPDALPPEELFAISDRERWHELVREAGRTRGSRFYALAELCADRIVERRGRVGLVELFERARHEGRECVPWPWIAEASGLVSRRDWLLAAYARLTPEDVVLLAVNQPGLVVTPLAAMVDRLLRPTSAGADPLELLRSSEARLVFASGEFLPLSELEPLVAALAERGADGSRGP